MEDTKLTDLTNSNILQNIRDVSYNTKNLIKSIVEDTGVLDEARGNKIDVQCEDGLPEYYFGNEDSVRKVVTTFLRLADCRVSKSTINLRVRSEKIEYASVFCISIVDKDTSCSDGSYTDAASYMDAQSKIEDEEDLAVAGELLDRMGGTLQIDSVSGTGSVYVLKIPQLEGKKERERG